MLAWRGGRRDIRFVNENPPAEAGVAKGSLPRSPELLNMARRLFWWMPPEEALERPARFVAQVMTFGTWNDVQCARAQLGEERFRDVLAAAPTGVFDERSWHYWHHVFGIDPVPPRPVRRLP